MKKTLMTLSVAATVVSASFLGSAVAEATTLDDLKEKSSEIQEQQSNVESGINSKEEKIEDLQSQQAAVTAEINRIDLAIGDAETKITEKNQQIEQKTAEIEKLKSEIDVLITRINQRNELLKERARAYQEGGGMVSYLDVLIGAQSFSDFIDRVGAVAVILEADQDILKEHKADKDALEQKQTQMEQDLTSLQVMKQELESLKAMLDSQKAEKSNLMASLQQQESQVAEEKLSLEEEQAILASQEAAVQKAIQLEQQRLADEQKKQAAAAAAAVSAAKNSSSSSSSTAVAPVSSGSFTRPAVGRLSSGFGYRSDGFHYGIDIANSVSVPIVAAADGVVIRSYMSSSYGNCVMISHSINGQTYTTVYAHLSSRSVSDGQAVSKGQVIGYMGNTGQSEGQHLHFELHRGTWNQAKSNAINPIGVVPL